MQTNTRPAVGTVLTVPAVRTRYNVVPGAPVPPGYHTVDGDDRLWLDSETVTIRRVRKVRKGFRVETMGGIRTYGLVLKTGWEKTYSAR